jgi:lysyl endopeptidase
VVAKTVTLTLCLPPALYTPDYAIVRGPFTAADNDAHGQFWSPILLGNEIVLELVLPADQLPEVKLILSSVNHGYTDFKRSNSPLSGSCNLDVVCAAADGFPQVDAWREQIRSSGVYTLGGTWMCSGALVNNTAQDMKPYFLTADHCGVSSGNAASVVVYWNFENSTCRQPGSPASGGPGDGSLAQFNSGAIFRAEYSASDFTLIEMDDPIDPAVNAFWSGWDARPGDFTAAIAIHHPNTDEKRISFEDDPTTTTSYLGDTPSPTGTHVRVADWDLGTTEPGSSGSPLYDPAQRIVGQLHGGYAACGNDDPDWYGRVSISWTGGGTAATRLSNWLDPLGLGVLYLDGRSTNTTPDFELVATPATANACLGGDAMYSVDVVQQNGFTDVVTLSASGHPAGTSASFSANGQPAPYSSILTIGNTGAAAAGSYAINIVGVAPTSTHTTTVQLNLFSGAPGAASLLTPANGATNVPASPTFTWSDAGATSYLLEVATDIGFSNIVYSATVNGTSHTAGATLNTSSSYFWRVRGNNACGDGSYSATYFFTTVAAPGDCGPGTVANVLYDYGFESGASGWTSGGTGNTWALVTTNPHSGANHYRGLGSSSVSDQRLISPAVALPAGENPVVLKFWHTPNLEASGTTACFDGGILEVSTNGGATWTQVPNASLLAGGYRGAISSSYSNPLAGLQGWCGSSAYINTIADLSAYAGQTAQFRMRLGTDTSVSAPGWDVDDVMVQSCVPAADASISLTKTVGVDPDVYPTTTAITVTRGTAVTYFFEVENTGAMTMSLHTLTDSHLGTVLGPDFAHDLAPGATVMVTATAVLTTTVTNEALWVATDGGASTAVASASATVNVINPAISLSKTVGTEAGVCATESTIEVAPGTVVYYCYTVTNTGDIPLAWHDLTDDQLGSILNGFAHSLAPGASVDTVAAGLTLSQTITTTVTSTAVWTAYNDALVTTSASATTMVNVPTHLLYLPVVMKP